MNNELINLNCVFRMALQIEGKLKAFLFYRIADEVGWYRIPLTPLMRRFNFPFPDDKTGWVINVEHSLQSFSINKLAARKRSSCSIKSSTSTIFPVCHLLSAWILFPDWPSRCLSQITNSALK